MSFDFIIWFFVGLACYLVVLGIATLVKFILRKRHIKKDDIENSEVIDDEKQQD